MIASDLIEQARDLIGLPGTERFPQQPLLRALGRIEREIYEAVVPLNEDALATSFEYDQFDIEEATLNEEPLATPDHYLILGATVRYSGHPRIRDEPFWLLNYKQREDNLHLYPSGYLLGQKLHLRKVWSDPNNDGNNEWDEVTKLTLRYVPKPAAPAKLDSKLTAPSICESFLVYSLAAQWGRLVGSPPEHTKALEAQAAASKESLISTLADQDSTETWTVRVV